MERIVSIVMLAAFSWACSSVLDFKPKARDSGTGDAADGVEEAAPDGAEDTIDVTGEESGIEGEEEAEDAVDADAMEAPDGEGVKGTVRFLSTAGGEIGNEQYTLYGSVRAGECGPSSGGGYTLRSCSVELLNH